MHEILTLQFGHFANFVGTHFWNSQEAYFTYNESLNAPKSEIVHDTLFRAGVTPRGIETYTPRLLLYDLKGGFGSLKKINKLYEESPGKNELHESTWNGRSETHAQMPYSKNIYLQHLENEEELVSTEETENKMKIETEDFKLDETVQFWSDFNRMYYHPKSVNTMMQYQFEDEFMPFDIFSYGKNAFLAHEKELDSFDENFRFFVEECDAIQGFQVYTSIIDGFGGFACSFLEQLRDEYPKTAIWSFGITENRSWAPKGHNSYYKQILNIALSTTQLTEFSSLFNPINTPAANQPNFKLILSSKRISIVSAAIETATLPFRSRHNFTSMFDLITQLNWRGNTKLGSLGLAFPLPISNFGEVDVNKLLPTENNNVIQDLSMTLMENKMQQQYMDNPLYLNSNGHVDMSVPNDKMLSVHSVPTLSHLTISTKSYNFLHQLANILQNLNLNLHPEYEEGDKGLTCDEFLETRETLWDLCEAFEDNSSSLH
ncbi:unnamed protein product [Rhizophagus irregularis]|nr:unnamed protein product [Rhizophagus irregularis]